MSDSGGKGICYPPQGSHHSETATAFTPATPVDEAAMKFLAITLALAIFAGSPASVCSEEPSSRLHALRENVEEYFRNISRPFEEQGALVRNLEVVQAVRDQASESFGNISRRFLKLGHELPKEVVQTVDLAIGIPGGVGEQLFYAIRDFHRKMEPATRDLIHALEPVVAPRAEQALEKVRPHTAVFRTRLEEMGQQQMERLKARLPDLGPQIKAALGYIREAQVALQPLADELQETLRQKAEGAANVARPYVKPVLDAAEKYTTELHFNPFFEIKQEQ